MPDVTNEQRADWAGDALHAFMRRTGQTDELEALGDLLANFMHWLDREVDQVTAAEDLVAERNHQFGMDDGDGDTWFAVLFNRASDVYAEEWNEAHEQDPA